MTTSIVSRSRGKKPVSVRVERVKLVRDAIGAMCEDCDMFWGDLWPQPVPWTWRNSKWMHENGTGHKVSLIGLDPK